MWGQAMDVAGAVVGFSRKTVYNRISEAGGIRLIPTAEDAARPTTLRSIHDVRLLKTISTGVDVEPCPGWLDGCIRRDRTGMSGGGIDALGGLIRDDITQMRSNCAQNGVAQTRRVHFSRNPGEKWTLIQRWRWCAGSGHRKPMSRVIGN